MANLESAEEFALRLVQHIEPRWTTVANVKIMAPAIEADRAVIALAAKRELLKDIADRAKSMDSGSAAEDCMMAYQEIVCKYAAETSSDE